MYYEDPAAAARWLHTVFGLDSWDKIPAEGEYPSWIELHVGSAAILLFKRTEKAAPRWTTASGCTSTTSTRTSPDARANGAKILSEIHQYGYRCYDAEDLEGHRWTFAQARPTMM